MQTHPLPLLALLALLAVAPAVQATPDCVTASADYEPGLGELQPSSFGYGRIEVFIPGPGLDGELGTYYIRINYDELKDCLQGALP